MSGHALHVALIAGPLALLALGVTAVDLLKRLPRVPGTVALAAALSAVAATVHAAVCPEHFREATVYGLFFAVAAVAQLGWSAVALLRPAHRWMVVGLAGNTAVLALWALTRTVGVPIGPGAGEVEPVGALDLVATAAELGVVAILLRVVSASAASRRLTH